MWRALVTLGTRPEAIKLGFVIVELQKPDSGFQVRVCVTGQHLDLLAASLRTFGIVPDDDLEAVIGRRQPGRRSGRYDIDVLRGSGRFLLADSGRSCGGGLAHG